jgi:hypothetical protein
MNPADLIAVFDEYLKKSGDKKNYIANKLKELFESTTSPLNPNGKPIESLKENMKSINKKFKDFKFPSMYSFNAAIQGALKAIRDFRDSFKGGSVKNFLKMLNSFSLPTNTTSSKKKVTSSKKKVTPKNKVSPKNVQNVYIVGMQENLRKIFRDINTNLRKLIAVSGKNSKESSTRKEPDYSPYYDKNDSFFQKNLKLFLAKRDFARRAEDRDYVQGKGGGFLSNAIGKAMGILIAGGLVYAINDNLNKTVRGKAIKELVGTFLYNLFDKIVDFLASPSTAEKIISGTGTMIKTFVKLVINVVSITFNKIIENLYGVWQSITEMKFDEAGKYLVGALVVGGLGILSLMKLWAIGKFIPGVNIILLLIEKGVAKLAGRFLMRNAPVPPVPPGGPAARGWLSTIGSFFSKIFNFIKGIFSSLLNFFKSSFMRTILTGLRGLVGTVISSIGRFLTSTFLRTIITGLGRVLLGLLSPLALTIAGIATASYFAYKAINEIVKSVSETNRINAETQENSKKWNEQNQKVLEKQDKKRNTVIDEIAKKQKAGTVTEKDIKDKKIAEYRNKMSDNLKKQSDLNEQVTKNSTFFRNASDTIFGTNYSGESEEQLKERTRLFEENRKLDQLIKEEMDKKTSPISPTDSTPKNPKKEPVYTPFAKNENSPITSKPKNTNLVAEFVPLNKNESQKSILENSIKTIDRLDLLANIFASGTQAITNATVNNGAMVAQAVASNKSSQVSYVGGDPIRENRDRAKVALG